jgi:hypothetical protein
VEGEGRRQGARAGAAALGARPPAARVRPRPASPAAGEGDLSRASGGTPPRRREGVRTVPRAACGWGACARGPITPPPGLSSSCAAHIPLPVSQTGRGPRAAQAECPAQRLRPAKSRQRRPGRAEPARPPQAANRRGLRARRCGTASGRGARLSPVRRADRGPVWPRANLGGMVGGRQKGRPEQRGEGALHPAGTQRSRLGPTPWKGWRCHSRRTLPSAGLRARAGHVVLPRSAGARCIRAPTPGVARMRQPRCAPRWRDTGDGPCIGRRPRKGPAASRPERAARPLRAAALGAPPPWAGVACNKCGCVSRGPGCSGRLGD